MNYNRPTYWEVHEVISTYVPDLITLFADGWERFPQGQAADILINALHVKAAWWVGREKPEVAARISAAADGIQERTF